MRPTLALLADAVSAARDRLETAFPGRAAEARPVAVGWATVESERAEIELTAALGGTLGPFRDAPDDHLLGARCRTAVGGPALFIAALEAATEGRLAASLARLDEGPAAVWFAIAPMPLDGTTPPAVGPFGPERLVILGPRDGRHLLLLDRPPGTIPT
jgi:hypothetical protein